MAKATTAPRPKNMLMTINVPNKHTPMRFCKKSVKKECLPSGSILTDEQICSVISCIIAIIIR